MSEKYQGRLSGVAGALSRRAVVLSLAGASVAGLSRPKLARAKNNKTQIIPASADTVVVNMNNALKFVPDVITIKAGTTVEWRNVESYPHSVTADKSIAANPANVELPRGAKAFNSGRIDGGNSWQYTFTIPGIYRYFCIPHEDARMLGTVVVS